MLTRCCVVWERWYSPLQQDWQRAVHCRWHRCEQFDRPDECNLQVCQARYTELSSERAADPSLELLHPAVYNIRKTLQPSANIRCSHLPSRAHTPLAYFEFQLKVNFCIGSHLHIQIYHTYARFFFKYLTSCDDDPLTENQQTSCPVKGSFLYQFWLC